MKHPDFWATLLIWVPTTAFFTYLLAEWWMP